MRIIDTAATAVARDHFMATSDFAPPERVPSEELRPGFTSLSDSPTGRTLNSITAAVALLNDERQIVFANDALASFVGARERESLCGMRPGEALECTHASERSEGCGTTRSCRICGAVNAILSSQAGAEDTRECRIVRDDGSPLDLSVAAKPLWLDNTTYTVLTVQDISHEKRRLALERVFFHDILNTAGALAGFSEFIVSASHGDDESADAVYHLSKQLIDEIKAHKELLAAESSELAVKIESIESLSLVAAIVQEYSQRGVSVVVDPASVPTIFKSDLTLLRRVIGNLVKNAVEASTSAATVTVTCSVTDQGVEFRIHNPGMIPQDAQLQIFQRSFSTKGMGRGLGTYGAKLLTERFLKGTLFFTSSEDKGTVFVASYPLVLS
jgi:nitrogen-specific signal transduction histidine kinase